MMRDVVIVSGIRTPVGAFGGTLKSTPVVELGALVLKETLKKVNLRPVATDSLTRFEPDALKGIGMIDLEKGAYDYDDSFQPVEIDEVILGNVVGAGQGQNVARQAMIMAHTASGTWFCKPNSERRSARGLASTLRT
jgi:acetyl-CoA C-acetyltransferase